MTLTLITSLNESNSSIAIFDSKINDWQIATAGTYIGPGTNYIPQITVVTEHELITLALLSFIQPLKVRVETKTIRIGNGNILFWFAACTKYLAYITSVKPAKLSSFSIVIITVLTIGSFWKHL